MKFPMILLCKVTSPIASLLEEQGKQCSRSMASLGVTESNW